MKNDLEDISKKYEKVKRLTVYLKKSNKLCLSKYNFQKNEIERM
jgi:hypothetical protein